jgi:hypothetical protein
VRDHKDSGHLFARFRELNQLLVDPTQPLTQQIKASMALGVLHIGTFGPVEIDATPEQRRDAALEVALELIAP